MKSVPLTAFWEITKTVRKVKNLPDDFYIKGISTDSRKTREGELFVALRGEKFDGHQFLKNALEKGACGVVADEEGEQAFASPRDPMLIVTNTLDFLMELAGWYRSLFTIPVIGITGSSGKTTAKEMLASVLATKFRVVRTEGNENNFIGVPLTLFQLDSDTEIAVVEMGTNHPGEIARLSGIVNPTHAAITNIGSGHIGYFGSKENIFKEKRALFDGVGKSGVIFINGEDEFLRSYSREDLVIRTFGFGNGADYTAENLSMDELGKMSFRVNGGPSIQLQVPGRHHVLNGLLAAAVGLEMGISASDVRTGMEKVRPVRQRMEVFRENDLLIINDAYNANPESVRAAIGFLCELPLQNGARRFAVIGDMLELGELSENEHKQVGQFLKDKSVDFVYCYGEKSRLIGEVLSNDANWPGKVRWFRTHEEIAAAISDNAAAGDALLIKGSRGMAMEKVLADLHIRSN
ncbi:MAG: UDP-N-acetylmuramoyl-tripeptide--D-alanyl-D-alanine ligase [Calditrichia bacterium]